MHSYTLFIYTLISFLGKIRIDKQLKGVFKLFQSIFKTINHYLYHPLFLVLTIPLSYLISGTLYAGQYAHFSVVHFFLLYSFTFINHLLGNFLFKKTKESISYFQLSFIAFEIINLLLIFYFSFRVHYLAGLLLLLYSLVIHLQFYLVKQGYAWLMLVFSSIFKGGILTYLSFYVQANFIPSTLFYWSIPLVLVVFLVEFGKLQLNYGSIHKDFSNDQTTLLFLKQELFNRIFLGLTVLIYLISFIIFIPTFNKLSFIILLTIPFALSIIQSILSTKKTVPTKLKQRMLYIYSISFFIAFSIILFVHIF